MKKHFSWKKLVGAITATALVSAAVVTGSTVAANAETGAQQEIRNATNDYRGTQDLPSLEDNSSMDAVAQAWAEHMASTGVLEHNPNVWNEIPGGYDYRQAGENVATGYPTPMDTVDGWWNSPGHHSNMMFPEATDIGTGWAVDSNGVSWAVEIIAKYQKAPTAPSNVQWVNASAVNSTTVAAEWGTPSSTGGSPITNYHVVFTNENTGAESVQDLAPNVNSTSIGDAAPGGVYSVSVSAVNEVGSSTVITSDSVQTPAIAPNAAGTPVISVADPYTFTVSWAAPDYDGGAPISVYTVELAPSAGGSGQTVQVDGSTLSTNFTGLVPNGTYVARVLATNVAGDAPWSGYSAVATAPQTPPSNANNVNATLAGPDSINVSWTAPATNGGSAITGYTVQLKNAGDGSVVKSAITDAASFGASFANLEPGSVYYVTVFATNAKGDSAPSDTPAVQVPAVAPGKPGTPTAELTDIRQITATWAAPSYTGGAPITGYVVTATPNTGAPVQVSVAGDATSYVFTGLNPGRDYTVTVAAVNEAGQSENSNTSEVVSIPMEPTAADPVRNASARATDSTNVVFTWSTPDFNGGSAIQFYTVNVFDANGAQVASLRADGADATSVAWDGATRNTEYTASITSTNAIGESQGVEVEVATPAEAPSQPGTPTGAAISGNSVIVTWTAPTEDGGAPITRYTVVVFDANGTQVRTVETTTNSASIGGLTPGAQYTFTVYAQNKDAVSAESAKSAAVQMWNVPSVPQNVTTSLLNATTGKVTWTAPAQSNGAVVNDYRITFTPNNGGDAIVRTVNATATSINVGPLSHGVNYTVTVEARNTVGWSAAAAGADVNVPAVAPGAPQNVVTSLAPYAVVVNWAAPLDNGGAAVTGYKVVLTDTNSSATVEADVDGATLTHTFSNLAAGTTYTATVVATNSVGNSPVSNVSNASTVPADAPDAPAAPTVALSGATSALVTWKAPVFDGGTPITGYKVTVTRQDTGESTTKDVSASTLSSNFINLAPGKSYVAAVQAVNAAGLSPVSANSQALLVPAVAPDAPQNVKATTATRQVNVSWAAPAKDGGAPVTSYLVSLHKIGSSDVVTVESTALSASFTGLNGGDRFYATVQAVNTAGPSVSSTASATVTVPVTVADAPTNVEANLNGEDAITVTYAAPAYNGGAGVTGYKVTLTGGGETVVQNVTGTEAVFENLTPGVSYTARVQAVNSVGNSASSAASAAVVIPAVAPDAPQNVVAVVSGVDGVRVTFDAPAFDGGDAIKAYRVHLQGEDEPRDIVVSDPSNRVAVFTGLMPGASYTATVYAINTVGEGAASAEAEVTVPATVPAQPAAPSVYRNDQTELRVTWTIPTSDGGAAIDGYKVVIAGNGQTYTYDSDANTFAHVFGGLKPGTSYTVTYSAHNSVGYSPASSGTVFVLPAVAPSAPQNVKATTANGNSVSATWEAPADNGGAAITSYNAVLYKNGVQAGNQVVNGLTVTFPADPASDYIVRVQAINSAGTGPATQSNPVTTSAVAPSAPQNVTAELTGSNGVTVNWDAPANNGGSAVQHYLVQLNGSNGDVKNAQVDATETTRLFADLAPGVTYTASVVAVNSIGGSDAGVSAGVKVPAVAPSAARNVSLTSNTPTSIQVQWVAPETDGGAAISGYVVTLTDADGNSTVLNVPGVATSVVFPDVKELTEYTATVVAVNEAGEAPVSAPSNELVTPPVTAPAAPNPDTFTDANDGDITVVSVTADYITVAVPDAAPGDWVYGYAFSTPAGLGWAQVGLNNQVTFPLAGANLAVGDHRLSVQNLDGTLNGWTSFTVSANPVPTPDNGGGNNANTTGNGSDNNSNTNNTAASENGELPNTGFDFLPYAVMAFLLLAAGGAVVISRRQSAHSNG